MTENNTNNNGHGFQEGQDSEEQKKDIPLFREEALKHRKLSYFGKSTIITPISYSVWTLALFLSAVVIVLFFYFGKYAKRQEVRGMLIPNKGLINVYAKNPGVVEKKFVKQGREVKQGDLLYSISTEQHSLSEQGAFAKQAELLAKQLQAQKSKLEIAKKNLERYKPLLKEKLASEYEYQQAYQQYLDVEFQVNKTEQELSQAQSYGDYAVRSPADGTISTSVAIVGDRVTGEKLLATIIPTGAKLRGVLFVPTSAVGFVKIGQKVLLKYDAYPYQSFGLYSSIVKKIDKSILYPKDVDIALSNNSYASQEPFYRVVVELEGQTVQVYGKPYPLTPGMTLQGNMLGDKRNIWQWVLEPIYNLRGSLTSS